MGKQNFPARFARWGGFVFRVCGGDEDDGDGVGDDGDGKGAGVGCCHLPMFSAAAANAATLLLALLLLLLFLLPPPRFPFHARTIINVFSVVVICRPYINNVFSVAGFCQYITFSFNSTVY